MKLDKNVQKMPSILKSSDVSKYLEVSPDDITLLARKGYIKGFKLGRQWRFKRQDILSWFKHHTKKEIIELLR